MTKEFVVSPDLMKLPSDDAEATRGGTGIARRIDAKDYLTAQGVTFPPGASVMYLPSQGKVVMKNTRENLDLLDAVVEAATANSSSSNLLYDPKARIQTGPAVPNWQWRQVSFGWNGPVQAGQQVRPILIPLWLERVLSILRVLLLLVLANVLIRTRVFVSTAFINMRGNASASAVALALLLSLPASTHAQETPDPKLLDALRERLLEPGDAFPHAADIPLATLTLATDRLTLDVEIHAAARCAVPLPGRLPAWSPVSVLVDGKPDAAVVRRDDGFLWVVLPAGVHRVRVTGLLAGLTEWEWSFLLKPRRVAVDAPGWTVSGIRPDGTPEAQVFLALQQKAAAGAEAGYDRQELASVVVVDRHLELGLIWQVRTTVSRLSPAGRALSLRLPLLPGESVLTPNLTTPDGAAVEVQLGAGETAFTWESGLTVAPRLALATRAEDTWVERWHLVASPVWNVALAGLAPIFEATNPELTPVWQPWPGEAVELAISRPEAITGATVTVSRGAHEIALGRRQRTSKLDLALRTSLGEDFLLDLPAEAEISALTLDGKPIPVRKDGTRLVIPLKPGEQSISAGWKINTPLGSSARAEAVRLPVESANISTTMTVPEDRWVLWADGPRRGPAVRFWVILICSLLAAAALGKVALSPLRTLEWMLLVLGLTQVPLPAALLVIAWLFLLAWRGRDTFPAQRPLVFNLLQFTLAALTALSLGILIYAVGEGLLGSPEMFIRGNGSTHTALRWFQPRSDALLPTPGCVSVSVWWYRLLMLLWALWLALALLRWLRLGWENFTRGGLLRTAPKPVVQASPVAQPPSVAQPPPLRTEPLVSAEVPIVRDAPGS